MKKQARLAVHFLLFLFAPIGYVAASDGSFADQFLGNPLLILVALIVIDVIAVIFHRIRK